MVRCITDMFVIGGVGDHTYFTSKMYCDKYYGTL